MSNRGFVASIAVCVLITAACLWARAELPCSAWSLASIKDVPARCLGVGR